MSQNLQPYHQTVFGLRVAKPHDMERIPEVEKVLRGFGPNATAMYFATALNMIEEQRAVMLNQRKRLAELEDQKTTAKKTSKYFSQEDTAGFLSQFRERNAPNP